MITSGMDGGVILATTFLKFRWKIVGMNREWFDLLTVLKWILHKWIVRGQGHLLFPMQFEAVLVTHMFSSINLGHIFSSICLIDSEQRTVQCFIYCLGTWREIRAVNQRGSERSKSGFDIIFLGQCKQITLWQLWKEGEGQDDAKDIFYPRFL